MAKVAGIKEKIDRLKEVRDLLIALEMEEKSLTNEVKEYMAEHEVSEVLGTRTTAKLGPVTTYIITPSALVRAVGSLKKAEPMMKVLITQCREYLPGRVVEKLGKKETDVRLYVEWQRTTRAA
jgi:hypothetical protein